MREGRLAGVLIGLALAVPAAALAAAAWQGLDGRAIDLDHVLAAPDAAHWLGTDALGRDVLARLAEGLRLSLAVGAAVVTAGGAVGIGFGMLAGWLADWRGGWVDAALMRIADIVLSFPGILLAIAMAAMLGPGVDNLVLALIAVGWVGFARLARAQTLSLRRAPFIEAARAAGTPAARIAGAHLLPNIAGPLLVEASFGLAAVIIGEAGLSFLGVGVQPPAASLGTMIREGSRLMLVAPWLVIWPGLVLFALVMAVNLAGDMLRDRLDVRGRR